MHVSLGLISTGRSLQNHAAIITEDTFHSVNAKKHEVVAKLYIPELRMKGNYKVAGQLLMLPIEGDGKFSAKYSTFYQFLLMKSILSNSI